MGDKLRILKGLGLVFLALILLNPLAISGDFEASHNETNQTNTTSLNASYIKASNPNPGVLPLNSKPGGLTYGEWNAKWWQWAFSMPIEKHPLFDTADCSQGQSGNVWFLGSTFATEPGQNNEVIAKVDRECTVPPGKMLFFPVVNVEGSKLEGNGETYPVLKEYTDWNMQHVIDLSAEIDGVPVKDLEKYQAPSPLFTFGPLPENNVLQWLDVVAPAGATSPSVADGIYLMLAPLSVGKHTIHFQGTFKFTEDPDGFDFVFRQDVKYNITVKPKWQPPRMFMLTNESSMMI